MRRHVGIYYIVSILFLLLLPACVQEELQQVPGKGEGMLKVSLAKVSSDVSTTIQTKATTITLPESLLPTSFKIDVKSGDTSLEGFPKDYIPEDIIVLTSGSYIVKIYSGTNDAIQEGAYFEGSTSVTILPNQLNTASLTVSLANAMLVPKIDNNLQKHYKSWQLTVQVGSTVNTLASNSDVNTLFVQANQTVNFRFSGQNLMENASLRETKWSATVAACTQYSIQCNPDNMEFKLDLTAAAEHYKNTNNELAGTRVNLMVNSLSGSTATPIKGWRAELYKGEMLVRSFSSNTSDSETITMNTENSKTFLTPGEYTLKRYLIKSDDTNELMGESSVVVPNPEIEVQFYGYTSYSQYLAGNVNSDGDCDKDGEVDKAANSCEPTTAYNIGVKALIATELVSSIKDGVYVKLNGGDFQSEIGGWLTDKNTFESLEQGAYKLDVDVILDGQTYDNVATKTYHITGLPYSYDLRSSKTLPTGWTVIGDTNWDDGCGQQILYDYYYVFGYSKSYAIIFSPYFILPQNTAIKYQIGGMFINSGVYNKTAIIYSGIVSDTNYSKSFSDEIQNSKSWAETLKTFSHETEMLEGNRRISIYHNELRLHDGTEYWMYLTTLDVLYR